MIATTNRIFCSFAFTGEEEKTVRERMQLIADTFKKAGIESYCNLFDPETEKLEGAKAFIDAALQEMNACDTVLVVMASDRRSEGMLIEIGAAYAAGKTIILARHESARDKTYIDKLATKTIDWTTNQDLQKALVAFLNQGPIENRNVKGRTLHKPTDRQVPS